MTGKLSYTPDIQDGNACTERTMSVYVDVSNNNKCVEVQEVSHIRH